MGDLEQIIHTLIAANRSAKRAPTHLKARRHAEINVLLDQWEMCVAVQADLDGLGSE